MVRKNLNDIVRLFFKEFFYFGINLIFIYGQFNNIIFSFFLIKKYFEKLISFYDFDLFSLNIDSNINFDFNFFNFKI